MPYVLGQAPGSGGVGPGPGLTAGHHAMRAGEWAVPALQKSGSFAFGNPDLSSGENTMLMLLLFASYMNLIVNLFRAWPKRVSEST